MPTLTRWTFTWIVKVSPVSVSAWIIIFVVSGMKLSGLKYQEKWGRNLCVQNFLVHFGVVVHGFYFLVCCKFAHLYCKGVRSLGLEVTKRFDPDPVVWFLSSGQIFRGMCELGAHILCNGSVSWYETQELSFLSSFIRSFFMCAVWSYRPYLEIWHHI